MKRPVGTTLKRRRFEGELLSQRIVDLKFPNINSLVYISPIWLDLTMLVPSLINTREAAIASSFQLIKHIWNRLMFHIYWRIFLANLLIYENILRLQCSSAFWDIVCTKDWNLTGTSLYIFTWDQYTTIETGSTSQKSEKWTSCNYNFI